jgi:glycosyltransferase involved in cell wall biosynthesis
VPPLSVLRASVGRGPLTAAPLRDWAAGAGGGLRAFELDGLRVEPVPFAAPPRPWSYGSWGFWMAQSLAPALARLRRAWRFDVVHAHNVVPTGHAAALWRAAARRRAAALVVSTHGPDVIHVARRGLAGPPATRATLRGADLVLANSTWAARRCEELGGPGTDVRARVVHLGTDVPAEADLPERHTRPTLVTVAHLQARKRHAVVLHALAELSPERRPDYVIVGDGPGRAPLEALAAELGVAERVRFTGQLDNARALREAWRCQLFVMPSVEEPFGVAYVEAMAGGLPVIGARGEGGPEDIAAAGDGLLLVPPDDHRALADAIAPLLADEGRRARLGEAARTTVREHFTWGRCGVETVAAYGEAIARRRRGGGGPA